MKLSSLLISSSAIVCALSLAGCGASSANADNPGATGAAARHTAGVQRGPGTVSAITSVNRSTHGWPTVSVSTVSTLPSGVVGNALAVDPFGHLVSVGGYTGQVSIDDIWRLTPSVSVLGRLPIQSHDAAAAYVGSDLFVFGGGQNASYNTILRLHAGQVKQVGLLAAPLSDAVCLPYQAGGRHGTLLIGGYDGQVFRHTVYFGTEQAGGIAWQHQFSLPEGVRYVAAATDGRTVYLAGGQTASGPTSAVYAWTPGWAGMRKIATLSQPVEKGALFVSRGYLILAGGLNTTGVPQSTLTAINTATGQTRVVGHLPTPLADMGYVQAGAGYLAGGMKSSQETDTSRSVYRLTFH